MTRVHNAATGLHRLFILAFLLTLAQLAPDGIWAGD